MEKDIRGLKLADETFMNTCQEVLASDLPRVRLDYLVAMMAHGCSDSNLFFGFYFFWGSFSLSRFMISVPTATCMLWGS